MRKPFLVEHHSFIYDRNCLNGPRMQPAVWRRNLNDFSCLPWFHATFRGAHVTWAHGICPIRVEKDRLSMIATPPATSNMPWQRRMGARCRWITLMGTINLLLLLFQTISTSCRGRTNVIHLRLANTTLPHVLFEYAAVLFAALDCLNELINRRALFSRCVH